MDSEQTKEALLPLSGRVTAVAIGAALIVITTTVPYLTLLNAFFFSGIFIAGMAAIYYAVIRHQVRLTYNEAFILGSFCGFAGGMFSETLSFMLIELTGYRPGMEGMRLLLDWARDMAAGKPELAEQLRVLAEMETLALAPMDLTLADLFIGILFASIFYAPVAGIGGMFTVLRLKRQAARGR